VLQPFFNCTVMYNYHLHHPHNLSHPMPGDVTSGTHWALDQPEEGIRVFKPLRLSPGNPVPGGQWGHLGLIVFGLHKPLLPVSQGLVMNVCSQEHCYPIPTCCGWLFWLSLDYLFEEILSYRRRTIKSCFLPLTLWSCICTQSASWPLSPHIIILKVPCVGFGGIQQV